MKKRIRFLSAVMAAVMSFSAMTAIPASADWEKTSDNKYYYTDSDGNQYIGWHKIDDELYYFDKDGHMKTGWLKTSGGKTYYLKSDGKAARSCILKINGVSYKFDKNGVLIEESGGSSAQAKSSTSSKSSASAKTTSNTSSKPSTSTKTTSNTSSKSSTSSKTTSNTSSKSSTASKTTSTSPSSKSQSATVYITPTGKRYHYSSSCNGGKYYKSTLSEAKSKGLTPCKKCVG